MLFVLGAVVLFGSGLGSSLNLGLCGSLDGLGSGSGGLDLGSLLSLGSSLLGELLSTLCLSGGLSLALGLLGGLDLSGLSGAQPPAP